MLYHGKRLFSMITVMNLTSLFIYLIFKIQLMKDILASTSMTIFLMVYLFWLTGDIFQAYDEMLHSFNIHLHNIYLKYFLCFCIDFCIHVLPFIIMGLPLHKISIIISLLIVDIWYIIIYKNASYIYTPIVHSKLHYSILFAHICTFFLFFIDFCF